MSDSDSRSPGESAGQESDPLAPRGGGFRDGLIGWLWPRGNGSARAEIEDALKEDEAGGASFSAEERAMLRAVLKLGDMRVDDVMVPRADIEAVEVSMSLGALLAALRRAGHSRMPVYRETLDDSVGMVHVKDVMAWVLDKAGIGAGPGDAPADGSGPPRFDFERVDLSTTLDKADLVRPVLFVPPSMPARMLLERMRASRTQMALVIDEYGGTDGLVSLEDLLEIVVGEIEDEHDEEDAPPIVRVADGQWIADARAGIEDARGLIGPAFGVEAHEEGVNTIGGLILSAIDRIPARGEIVHAVEGFEFEILDADPRRIKRVRIRDRRKSRAAPRPRTWPAEDEAPAGPPS